MQDLKIDKLEIVEDSEALRNELLCFINIRAGHINNKNQQIEKGELEFDVKNGLDIVVLTEQNETQVKNYIRKQLLTYYKGLIIKINKLEVEKKNRELIISFEYVDKFGRKEEMVGGVE